MVSNEAINATDTSEVTSEAIVKGEGQNTEVSASSVIELTEFSDGAVREPLFELPEQLTSAYEALDKALDLLGSELFDASMKWVGTAIEEFSKSPKVDLKNFVRSKLANREKPISARARALLLDATYKALCGLAEEAKAQFLSIGEEMYASPAVRVNALIKAACLAMTVDQDMSACLYTFKQAQTVCPDCPDVYFHRGQINLLAEKLDDALHDFNATVRLKPDFSVAQAQKMYTLYRRDLNEGRADAVELRINEFRKLVEKYPSCLETHSLYAQVLTERGDFEKSDAEFGRIIDLAPNSGMAYAHRGLLQLRWRQDHAAAALWFRKGIEVDPRCELVLELLGQLSMERGMFEDALGYFNQAIEQAKTQTDLMHLISLREGVKAQMHVCKTYNISVSDMFASLQQEFQQNIGAF